MALIHGSRAFSLLVLCCTTANAFTSILPRGARLAAKGTSNSGSIAQSSRRTFSGVASSKRSTDFFFADSSDNNNNKSKANGISNNNANNNNANNNNNNSDDNLCTVQILMSDTGGGHRASANALRDALDTLYPGRFYCDIVDLFTEYAPFWPFNDAIQGYKFMAKYPITWEIFFRFGSTEFGMWLFYQTLNLFCYDAFKKCMNKEAVPGSNKRADMVVSVHPLVQDIPLKLLADLDTEGASKNPLDKTTPFCTVVTDLGGAHPLWFNPFVDKCFVPSDVLYQAAKRRRLQDSQIVQYGLPIRKGFWSTSIIQQTVDGSATSTREMRSKLGLDPECPTVLLVGGGDGMGGIEGIANAIAVKLGSNNNNNGTTQTFQLVVICGSNTKAKASLEAKTFGAGVKVKVCGFVSNMDEYMRASDTLVTKAGPGTIAEASICGLPCMMFTFLPGQEEGNIPFVEESGFGKYSGDTRVIADTVASWLNSPEKLKSMREAALAASRPKATLDIARDLAEIAFATKDKNVPKVPKRQMDKVMVKAR